jgi:hypothetical protein
VIAKVEWYPGELYPRVGFIVTNVSRPEVGFQLQALAYNLGNFLRTLATPEPIKYWSLTTQKESSSRSARRPLAAAVMSPSRWPRSPSQNSVRRYPAAGLGTTAATGGSHRREALDCFASDQKPREVRLDDDKIRIFGARRADVTCAGAWVLSCRGFGIAKIL